MSALEDLIQSSSNPQSGGSALESLFNSTTTATLPQPQAPNLAPAGGGKLDTPGTESYRTPSGSTWTYLPDGTRQINLNKQFGGGTYNINPNNPSSVVNTGHGDYG